MSYIRLTDATDGIAVTSYDTTPDGDFVGCMTSQPCLATWSTRSSSG